MGGGRVKIMGRVVSVSNGLAIGGLLPGEAISFNGTNVSIYIRYYVILYYVNPSLAKECTLTYAYKDAS